MHVRVEAAGLRYCSLVAVCVPSSLYPCHFVARGLLVMYYHDSWLRSRPSGNNRSFLTENSPQDLTAMAVNVPSILRTTSPVCQAGPYSSAPVLRTSDGHESQSGSAYTRHCLRSSRVRPIRSRRSSRSASTVSGWGRPATRVVIRLLERLQSVVLTKLGKRVCR